MSDVSYSVIKIINTYVGYVTVDDICELQCDQHIADICRQTW